MTLFYHFWIAIFQDSLWGNAIYVKEANSISVELRKNVSNGEYFLNSWSLSAMVGFEMKNVIMHLYCKVWPPIAKCTKLHCGCPLLPLLSVTLISMQHLYNFLLQTLCFGKIDPIFTDLITAQFKQLHCWQNSQWWFLSWILYTSWSQHLLCMFLNDRLSSSLYYLLTLLTRRCLPIWMMMSVYLIKL